MKKIITILSFFIVLGCGSDDNGDTNDGSGGGGNTNIELTFNVTIAEVEYSHAVIAWEHPNTETNWLYRVVLDNEVLVDGLSGTSFTINNLDESTDYSGSVFAIGANDSDTFDEFNFSTRAYDYCLDQDSFHIQYQYQIDNFTCTEVDALLISPYPNNPITDLSGLSVIEKANSISIRGVSVSSLQGLENVRPGTENGVFFSLWGAPMLEDISAIESFIEEAHTFEFVDMPQFTDLSFLQFTDKLKNIHIRGYVTTLPDFGNHPLDEVVLFLVPITNFSGFRHTPEIHNFKIVALNNITGFAGFDHIEKMYQLEILNCNNLTNLNDLETLTGSTGQGDWADKISFFARENDNLTNYCGLRNWMLNTEMKIGCFNPPSCTNTGPQFNTQENAYNPTEVQIESPTDCSL